MLTEVMTGFEVRNKNDSISKYVGRNVVIFTTQGNRSYSGFMKEVTDDGFIKLGPFVGGIYDDNGLTLTLIEEDCIVDKGSVLSMEPATKESLEAYCRYRNKHAREAKKADKPKASRKDSQQ